MLGPELVLVGQTDVLFEGKRYTFFAGNDYHRLSRHPEVIAALGEAAQRYGINSAGSRGTTANHPLYTALEARAAAFLGAETAALFSAGYLSPAAVVQAVADEFSLLFMDESAHASVRDAALLSGREVVTFRHRDPEHLGRQLAARLPAGGRPLLLTDGVFPNTGALPPLADYARLLDKWNGRILVDDAHAVGVVGPTGKGSWEEAGVPRELVYQAATLSKALGGWGGIVAGPAELVSRLRARGRCFVGSTPIPLPLAVATLRAIEVLQAHPEKIARLRSQTARVKASLRRCGFPVSDGTAAIGSVTFGDDERNGTLARILLERGIYPPFIHYPGCPPGGHFRLTLSSAHSDAEIDRLLAAIQDARAAMDRSSSALEGVA